MVEFLLLDNSNYILKELYETYFKFCCFSLKHPEITAYGPIIQNNERVIQFAVLRHLFA
jgi:hypothetical protein